MNHKILTPGPLLRTVPIGVGAKVWFYGHDSHRRIQPDRHPGIHPGLPE